MNPSTPSSLAPARLNEGAVELAEETTQVAPDSGPASDAAAKREAGMDDTREAGMREMSGETRK